MFPIKPNTLYVTYSMYFSAFLFVNFKKKSPNYHEQPKLPGLGNFTIDQTFFLGSAHAWCAETLDKAAINQMKMDTHPPNKLRVNQAFRNFKPFSDVWSCPVGSPMNPEEKCNLW